MAKWNFTASDGTKTTVTRDDAWVAGMAAAHGKNATVTRDDNGTVTKAEFTKSDGTATYTRAG